MLNQKPVDRWLQIASIAVGLLFYLLPKTPSVIVVCLLLIFLLLIHPVWNFWWIEKKTWRRLLALLAVAMSTVLVGIIAWPEPASLAAAPTPSLFTRLSDKTLSIFNYVRGWPWPRILVSGLMTGSAGAIILAFIRERKARCQDKRLHALAKQDRTNIAKLVRFPGIIYQPNFAKAYIDFGFSVFNNSLFDVLIENAVSGEIRYGEDNDEFYYPPKFLIDGPIECRSRSGAYFVIRQPIRLEEIPRFRDVENVLVWFHGLEIHFRGSERFPEIGRTQLSTAHYLETKKRIWRDWNDLDFIFGYTDDQWALLSSRPQKQIAEPQTQTPTPPPPKSPPAEPNIVYESTGVVDVHRAHRGFIKEGEGPPDLYQRKKFFPAAIVTFRNKVIQDRQIGGRGNISARATFISYDEEGVLPANRIIWLGSDDDFTVTFRVNDPHSLVVAILENGFFVVQENTTHDYENPTKSVPLKGYLHKVHIELISESESKTVSEVELMLDVVKGGTWTPILERPYRWKRRKLTEITKAGRDLMERQSASESELEKEYQEWEAQTAQFVATHLGDAFTTRFRPPPHVPPPGTPTAFRQLSKALEPVGVYNKTRAKVETLERFKDEAI